MKNYKLKKHAVTFYLPHNLKCMTKQKYYLLFLGVKIYTSNVKKFR